MIALDEDDWYLVRIAYTFLASIAIIGIISNSLLLYTTIVTKNLRSTCNILIGCCALFDMCHNFGALVQFPQVVFKFYIDSRICSVIQILPELCLSAGAGCIVFIGIDRLLSFIFIVEYQSLPRKLVLVHLTALAIYCSYTPFLMHQYFVPQPIICTITSVFHGEAAKLWSYAVNSANLLSIIIYVVGWITIRRRKISLDNRRLFRSLCAVMAIETVGWMVGSGAFTVIHKMEMKEGTRFALGYVCGLPVNAAVAMKTLVYYSISTEYSQAIRNVLRKSNSIDTVSYSQ